MNELKRIRRVSDMLVTAHAILRTRYALWSLISEIGLFACTIVLCVFAFADKSLLIKHLGENSFFYIGIFSILIFIYSFISNRLDWKVKSEKHKYAFERYLDIKFECNEILKRMEDGENLDPSSFLKKYHTSTPFLVPIPEKFFIKCKKQYTLKVFISKYLDDHPGASIFLLRAKIWIRDNFKKKN